MSPPPLLPPAHGFADPGYAESLRDMGTPIRLPRSGGSLLVRSIPGTPWRDAAGCYPLFACADWSELGSDLDSLPEELVSVTLVADPMAAVPPERLGRTFDLVRPFKTHYVADLQGSTGPFVTRDHRRCAQSARNRGVRVEECAPAADTDAWIALYHDAMRRFGVPPHRVLSREALAAQARLPGLVMLRAAHEGRTLAFGQFVLGDDTAYAHLAAYTADADRLRASCALYAAAIEGLAGRVRWIDWGGNAGHTDDPSSPLAHFKRGWSNTTRVAHLCGRIRDAARYAALNRERAGDAEGYFPAYRAGEG